MGMFCRWKLKSLQKKARQLQQKLDQDQATDIDTKKLIMIHHQLVKFYQKRRFNKKYPNAAIYIQESYRVAANLNDVNAQYELGKIFLEQGKFWDAIELEVIYHANVHVNYAKTCYHEAFAFLDIAKAQGHIQSKRLYGQALINGWGCEKNQDQGFQLIVESIEQANAWEKATKIFEQLGLNRPEFFSSIMDVRKKVQQKTSN